MKKPNIPNFKIVVVVGSAALVLLIVLIVMIVVLNSMEAHLVTIQVPSAPVTSTVSRPPSSEAVTSQETSSEEEASSKQASSKKNTSSKSQSKPQSKPQQSSSQASSAASVPPSSSSDSSSASSGDAVSSSESSVPQVPTRADGITRIELINITGGKTADLSTDKIDEFLASFNQLVLEITDEPADTSTVADARIRIHKGNQVVAYTVYPYWTQGTQVCLELSGGKQFLQYLKTLDVFAGQAFAY